MVLFMPELEEKLYKEKMEEITEEGGHELCPKRKMELQSVVQ